MPANSLFFFRRIIYKLKRLYGFDIAIYRTTETIDLKTGRKTLTRTKINVRKSIILPSSIFRDFSAAGLSKLNTDLQLGGLLDTDQRTMIIDKTILPKNFVLNANDYIVFKHRRYNIIKIGKMEVVDYVYVDVKETVGEPIFEVHEAYFRHKLYVTDQNSITD